MEGTFVGFLKSSLKREASFWAQFTSWLANGRRIVVVRPLARFARECVGTGELFQRVGPANGHHRDEFFRRYGPFVRW
jgi:hypothetical protein